MKYLILISFMTGISFAQDPYKFKGLSEEDQKYFKNEAFDGKNKLERIDENVKEINKLHGEVQNLKNEIKLIKEELAKVKRANERK